MNALLECDPSVSSRRLISISQALAPATEDRFTKSNTTKIPSHEFQFPASTEESLTRASQAIARGAYVHARALLVNANLCPIEGEPMCRGWAQLGAVYFENKDYPKMEEAYGWAKRYNPSDISAAFNLALAQHLQKKHSAAETSYLLVEQLRPGLAKVWCNLGALYFETARYPEAAAALRRAIDIQPRYARAWDNLASTLGAQEKLDEALVACRMALLYQPDYPESHYKLGVILFQQGSLEEAETAFGCVGNAAHMADEIQDYLSKIRESRSQFLSE